MKPQENTKDVIVINKMYAGEYLDDNIGHEIINLFKADNDVNYIYLCKDGKYPKEKKLPKYTIQVRTHSTRTLEIISIAEIESKVSLDEIKEIKYGGKSITEIFDTNIEQGTETYVTFKAKQVIKPHPHHPVYIAYMGNRKVKEGFENRFVNNNSFILNEKASNTKNEKASNTKYNFDVNEQLRNYVENTGAVNSDYSKLCNIIKEAFDDKEKHWNSVSEKIEIKQETLEKYKQIEVTPAEIYGIGCLELPFSNAFSFFLKKYPQLLLGFCQYLKCDNEKLKPLCEYFSKNPDAKLTIKREWKNIDILVEIDKEWVICVENKIFSDLNGKIGKHYNQLDKYYDIIEKEYKDWKKIYVLLTPNHNNIDLSNKENWQKLFYSSVAGFLKTVQIDDDNLTAFATMVERHSVEDYNLGEMRRRFERVLIGMI